MDITYRFNPYEPLVSRQLETADDAVAHLRAGHARFNELAGRLQAAALGHGFDDDPLVYSSSPMSRGLSLVGGAAPPQQPLAIVLSCSDARVPVEELFQVSANSLFVVRVAGNTVGTEILGSIAYALHHFRSSVRLLVVLGHTGCGAVTAAVDTFQRPNQIDDLIGNYALKSLVDRLLLPVRIASQTAAGNSPPTDRSRRVALIESAIYINAAVTAFQLGKELALPADGPVKVMYGAYDLRTNRVQSQPCLVPGRASTDFLAEAPGSSAELSELACRTGGAFQKVPDVGSMTDLLLPAFVPSNG